MTEIQKTKKSRLMAKEQKHNSENAAKPDKGNLNHIVIRNDFYRDGYRTLLKVAIIEGVVILSLVALMFFFVNVHQPENRYFATTEDGRLIPMVPLSQPNLSTPALMSWSAQASTEVMNFGHHDFRRRLQEASRHFTRQGWESFTQALQESRYIDRIVKNRQVITAAPQGAPILKEEGLVLGRYQWIVEIPMVLTFQAGSKSQTVSFIVRLVVVRVPRLESPSGVGIAQWIQIPI